MSQLDVCYIGKYDRFRLTHLVYTLPLESIDDI